MQLVRKIARTLIRHVHTLDEAHAPTTHEHAHQIEKKKKREKKTRKIKYIYLWSGWGVEPMPHHTE